MLYCPSCGVAAQDDARFCPKCGGTFSTPTPHARTVFESAQPQSPASYPPPAQSPGYSPYSSPPPPSTPQYQQGYQQPGYQQPYQQPGYQQPFAQPYPPPALPQKKSNAGLWAVLALVVAVGGAAVLFATHVLSWPFGSSGAKEAVEKARQAYNANDAATFDKYVDLESVINDIYDQMAAAGQIQANIAAAGKANLGIIASAVKSLLFGTPSTAPQPLIDSLKPSVDQMRNGLRSITYKGIASENRNGTESLVKVNLYDASVSPPKTRVMELKVHDVGPNWKIYGVTNFIMLEMQ